MIDIKWNKTIEEYSDEEIEQIKNQKEATEILDIQERELELRLEAIKSFRDLFWEHKNSIKAYKRMLKSRNGEKIDPCSYIQNPNKEE